MRLTVLLASAAVALIVLVGGPSAAASDPCAANGTVEIRPAGIAVAVNHEETLVLRPQFDQSYLIPGSVTFHVSGPSGSFDLPDKQDNFGVTFTPKSSGTWSAYATWSQTRCDQPAESVQGQTPTIQFEIVKEQPPSHPRFIADARPGHPHPLRAHFNAGIDCPPAYLANRDPISATIYFEVGKKRPTHASRHTGYNSPKGCSGFETKTRYRSWPWGYTDGAYMFVEAPHKVRVLAEIYLNGQLVVAKRVRFKPVRGGETILPDR